MLRFGRGRLTQGLVALLCTVGISWLALEYFVPLPPSNITLATGGKGTTFDYFGERYRERFARAGVALTLRETAGAMENFRLSSSATWHLVVYPGYGPTLIERESAASSGSL